MKQLFLIILSALMLAGAGTVAKVESRASALALPRCSNVSVAKDLRVLVMTPTPKMHCENCENKIKKNLRFEKGVVKIETSVPEQTVAVTYDATKTDVKKLQAAMKQIGYDTKVVSDKPQAKPAKEKKKK